MGRFETGEHEGDLIHEVGREMRRVGEKSLCGL
jgi:hypothetical protein